MERIIVDQSNISPVRKEWEATVNSHQERTLKLPVVASGAVTPDRAMKWLEVASKLYSSNAVGRLLDQVSGLGAKDIRTLVANDRKEYFPKDSAQEVFDRKQLKTITPPNAPDLERERILTNIVRTVLQQRYGLNRDRDTENQMAMPTQGGRAEWLVGKPALVGKHGDQSLLFDIEFSNSPQDITQADQVRLHYYDLVANNIGRPPHQLNLAKVHIDEKFADSLITLARLSKSAENSLTDMVKEFDQLPKDQFHIEVHQVDKQPEIYKEIIGTGQKHWQDILKGDSPHQRLDPPLELSEDKQQSYTAHAKEFLAASQAVKASEELRKQAMHRFIESMSGYDISDNFSPPYAGALLRKYDHFDAESAARYLEKNMDVDPAHLRTPALNIELLLKAFERMGGDASPFYENGSADKKAIETVAEEMGLDLSAFYTRQMKAIVNPKTRGPIHDSIVEIRDSAMESIKEVNQALSSSKLADSGALIGEKSPNTKQTLLKM